MTNFAAAQPAGPPPIIAIRRILRSGKEPIAAESLGENPSDIPDYSWYIWQYTNV